MCGLVGMAGNIIEQDKVALRWLLDFDRIRGMDSTGLAVVSRQDSKINVFKKAGVPDELFKDLIFNDKGVYIGPPGKVFIGHNRAATRGSVTDANAHPFHHGDVVGAHNGTLISTYGLEKGNDFDVDSEAIFYNLSKYTPDSVIPDVYGAYALTWYDGIEDKLFVLRNGERPLYWTRRMDNDVVYWASESWMLDIILDKLKIKHTPPVLFKMDMLYELDMKDVAPAAFRKVEWVADTKIEGYEPPTMKKPAHTASNYHKGGNTSNILPFVGSSNNSNIFSQGVRSKAEILVMKGMEGKEIAFRFDRIKTGMSKSEYLSAYPEDTTADWDIRIYGTNNKSWEDWKSKTHNTTFKGKIKKLIENRYGAKKEVYFLIDLRSIVEVVEAKTEESLLLPKPIEEKKQNANPDIMDMLLEGYQGRFLSTDEWMMCTDSGCENCAGPGSVYDQDLVFIDHDKFICGDCIDQFPEHNPQAKVNKEC